MAGLGPWLYSQPKHATHLENFLLHITRLSKSTRKTPKNVCWDLYKLLSLRIRASLLGHYVSLTLGMWFLIAPQTFPDGGFGNICSRTITEGTATGYQGVWICPSPDGWTWGTAHSALASYLKEHLNLCRAPAVVLQPVTVSGKSS